MLHAARTRFAAYVWGAVAIVIGAAAGFLLVLFAWALPSLPMLVIGFAGGVLIGSAVTVAMASRFPFLRKAGGLAILLAPLLVILGPFLLIGGAVVLLGRLKPRAAVASDPRVIESPPARRATRKRR